MAESHSAAPQSSPQDSPLSKSNRSPEAAILFSIALAILGTTISLLLVQIHAGGQTIFCPRGGGCEAVLASKYSSFFGIPMPWIGVVAYLSLLGVLLFAFGTGVTRLRVASLEIALWLSVAGASFSAVLMFLQLGVLHAFCPLCTASALVLAALVITTARADKFAANPEFTGRCGCAWTLGCVATLLAGPQIASALVGRDETLATVDGEQFTRKQMESEIGASLEASRRSVYQLEFEWVRKKVDDSLLANEARTRGMTVAALLATRPRERAQLLAQLANGHHVQVFLRAPKVRWLKVDLSTAKLAGPRDAPVQLVVFSDFQCRFCAELAALLRRIRAEFPDKVLVAYRYFPIENHTRAVPAAIAAECAADQGKFWEYHDKLFAEPGDLSDSVLLKTAEVIGLNQDRFRQCLNSERARDVVETSRKEAEDLGLEGAPTIALNGRIIGGMVTYEKLVAELQKELGGTSAR